MTLDLTPDEISLLTQSLVIVTSSATRPDGKPLDVATNLEVSAALIRKLNAPPTVEKE